MELRVILEWMFVQIQFYDWSFFGAGDVVLGPGATGEHLRDRGPAQGEYGEGVDQPRGAVGQRVERAKRQSNFPFACW